MSRFRFLAAAGALALAAVLAAPAAAQVRSGPVAADRGAVRVAPPVQVRPAPVRPLPVRPDPIRLDPIRLDPTRIDPTRTGPTRIDPTRHERPDDHLQERMRNACFNSANPPVPLCRRYFGDGGGARAERPQG